VNHSYSAAAHIKSGKLVLDDQPGFQRSLRWMKDGPVTVRIQRKQLKRSLDQNAYWWAVPVRLIAEHCGYTDSQMHYALLGECFGYIAGPNGQPVPVKPSSSDLTREEFTHLIEWVLTWAPTELGVIVPEPHEHLKVSA
jgi:hypothetical protein